MALPLTLAYTAADGTNLTTLGFTNNQGAFQVNTNAAASNTAATETATHDNTNTYNNDQYAFGTLSALAGGPYIGVAVRCDTSAASWYEYYTDSVSDATLAKIVAGTWTSIATGAAAAVSDVLRLEVSGTSLSAYKNGAIQFGGAKTDSALSSGFAGLSGYSNGAGSRIDNTEFGNLGVVSVVPPLLLPPQGRPYFATLRM